MNGCVMRVSCHLSSPRERESESGFCLAMLNLL